MKYLFSLLLICFIPLNALTLKEKFAQAEPGDYIMTAQGKNYSTLFIRSLSETSLVLEEITAPEKALSPQKIKDWVARGAPGHSSWIAYEIDLQENTLKECYSFDQKGWLFVREGEFLLAKLLAMSLDLKPETRRKRIGPAPTSGEPDHRAIWNPPLISEGKKIPKAKFEVWSGRWPKDDTPVSDCEVEFYFTQSFAMPYWIEIKSPHYAVKIRTVNSGKGLTSFFSSIPKRPPQFVGGPQKMGSTLRLTIKNPAGIPKLHLLAVDLAGDLREGILVPCQMTDDALDIAESDLKALLKPGHRYQWILVPEDISEVYAEMEIPFTWKGTL
jgi:hypothetical protein